MSVTVIADDIIFERDDGLGVYRVQLVQRGECQVEVILSAAVMQIAIHRAIKIVEARAAREANVIAFPMPVPHADTA